MEEHFDRIADFFVIGAVITIIVLKIIGIITIPWIWLLAPIWIPLGIGCIGAMIIGTMFIIECKKEKRNERY